MTNVFFNEKPIALVVLYNPTHQNIQHLSKLNKDLNIIAWKNSDCNIGQKEFKFFILNEDDKLPSNIGLSEGLNKVIYYLHQNNCDDRCITLLDQDTLLNSNQIISLQKSYFKKNISHKAFIVPEIVGSNGYPWRSWFGITNGMTLKIYDLIKVGGFDPKLYADCADVVISEKLKKFNYQKFVSNKIIVTHNIGDAIKELFLPDLKESIKQKRYIKLRYFFHQSKIRRAMKLHSYLYLLTSDYFLLKHPIWSLKKFLYLIINIKSIGFINTFLAIKYGIKKKVFPFHKIK